MTTEEYIKLLDNNNKFNEEYKKNYLKADILQRRINKAIEYLENTYKGLENEDGILPMTLHDQELLEILQGSDKE